MDLPCEGRRGKVAEQVAQICIIRIFLPPSGYGTWCQSQWKVHRTPRESESPEFQGTLQNSRISLLALKIQKKIKLQPQHQKFRKKIKLQPHLFIPKCIKETFRLFGDEEFTARGELGAAHAGTRGSASRKIHGTDFLTQLGWSSTPALGCLGLLFILFQINFLQALN